MRFVPPTHTLECIFYFLNADGLIVSNSLAFLLNELDDALATNDFTYSHALNKVADGLDRGVAFLHS